MKEAELQSGIIDLAHALGWIVAHFRPALTDKGWRTPVEADGAGFPDLVLVRDRIIFAECKVGGRALRPEQSRWLAALRNASPATGVEVYTWTDGDWKAGVIEDRLQW